MEKFQRESLTLDFFEEGLPLFHRHYRDISANQDIKLEIDFERYFRLQDAGAVRLFTARAADGKLIGYAVFHVMTNMRYKSSLQATQDVLFVHPEFRGCGMKLVEFCDNQLRNEGVQVVYHHTKAKPELNFGPALERRGYKLVDLIYSKRLDKEGH